MENNLSTAALIAITAVGGAGVLLGSIITGFVNWLLSKRQNQREDKTWLREKRFTAIAVYMEAAQALNMRSLLEDDETNEPTRVLIQAFAVARESVILLLPEHLVEPFAALARDTLDANRDRDRDGFYASMDKTRTMLLPVVGISERTSRQVST